MQKTSRHNQKRIITNNEWLQEIEKRTPCAEKQILGI